MGTQVRVTLTPDLKRMAERYAKRHGFKSVRELTEAALRDKILGEEGMKETLEIMADKKLMRSLMRSIEDVKAGRVYTWEELQERWKKAHAKK